MSAHAPVHAIEDHHPGAREYFKIAVILAVLTAVEVAVYYIEAMRFILPVLLIGLSTVKFAIVVMFYMHLKFDNRLFTGLFVFALSMATFTILVLIALFHGLVAA